MSKAPRMRTKLEDVYKRLDESNEQLEKFRNNGLIDGYTAEILGYFSMAGLQLMFRRVVCIANPAKPRSENAIEALLGLTRKLLLDTCNRAWNFTGPNMLRMPPCSIFMFRVSGC